MKDNSKMEGKPAPTDASKVDSQVATKESNENKKVASETTMQENDANDKLTEKETNVNESTVQAEDFRLNLREASGTKLVGRRGSATVMDIGSLTV